jgi:hypothetical protein
LKNELPIELTRIWLASSEKNHCRSPVKKINGENNFKLFFLLKAIYSLKASQFNQLAISCLTGKQQTPLIYKGY